MTTSKAFLRIQFNSGFHDGAYEARVGCIRSLSSANIDGPKLPAGRNYAYYREGYAAGVTAQQDGSYAEDSTFAWNTRRAGTIR